ncbi:MAG: hypothetical protein WBX15_08580 [Thermoanaerobaculia bacterium]
MTGSLFWFASLGAAYLLFSGHATVAQGIAAAIVGAAGSAVAAWLRRTGGLEFAAPGGATLARLAAIPAKIPLQAARLAGLLLHRMLIRKQLQGAHDRVPLHSQGDAGQRATERAVMMLELSATPETFVVGTERDALLIHRLDGGSS